jgi:hypothetical protein
MCLKKWFRHAQVNEPAALAVMGQANEIGRITYHKLHGLAGHLLDKVVTVAVLYSV